MSAEWRAAERRPEPSLDSRVEKWRRWLKRIDNEILSMHAHQDMYREVGKIVSDHGSLPASHFFDYLAAWYGTTQAAAVRRQADIDPRVVSLARLLKEIAGDAGRLTREWFLAHYAALDERHGVQGWNERFGGDIGEHLDPKIVEDDLSSLRAAADRVSSYVDKHVAHADQKPLKDPITFEDLNDAIDGISEYFRKYTLLLTQSSWATLVPVPQYDWKAIFREPWIKPEGNSGAT
jgi:hypothetical protein